MQPPKITEGTVPITDAATPLSNCPSSLDEFTKIELTDERPNTLWNTVGPSEYGFYSNVNPDRPHPRWSQASERRIGELSRRPTLPFNGYAEQVADMYKDMDLNLYY